MPEYLVVSGFDFQGWDGPIPPQDFATAAAVLRKFGFCDIKELDSMMAARYEGAFTEFPALDIALTAAFASKLSPPIAFREPADSDYIKRAYGR